MKGSLFIPDGLLPSHKENPNEYHRIYHALRLKHDPEYREQARNIWRKAAKKQKEKDPNHAEKNRARFAKWYAKHKGNK